MKWVRTWFVVLFGWLFVFYNIERLHEPINLASFVYALVPVCCLPIILVRQFHRMPPTYPLAAVLPAALVMKGFLGYQIAGQQLPLTVTELGALAVTILLSHRIGRGLEEFYQAVATTAQTRMDDRSMPFELGQAEMYREVRRARQFHRPLTMLTITANEDSMQASLDRFIREVQQMTVRQYVTSKLASLLSSQMKDCDIITYRDDHFVAVLPETEREGAMRVVEQLRSAAQSELGLQLKIGTCTFPEEEVTFVNLLSNAESQLIEVLHNGRRSAAGKAAARKQSPSMPSEKDRQKETEFAPSATV